MTTRQAPGPVVQHRERRNARVAWGSSSSEQTPTLLLLGHDDSLASGPRRPALRVAYSQKLEVPIMAACTKQHRSQSLCGEDPPSTWACRDHLESMNGSSDENDGVPEQSRARRPYMCGSSHEERGQAHARDCGKLCLARPRNGSGVPNITTIIMQSSATVCHTEGGCLYMS